MCTSAFHAYGTCYTRNDGLFSTKYHFKEQKLNVDTLQQRSRAFDWLAI